MASKFWQHLTLILWHLWKQWTIAPDQNWTRSRKWLRERTTTITTLRQNAYGTNLYIELCTIPTMTFGGVQFFPENPKREHQKYAHVAGQTNMRLGNHGQGSVKRGARMSSRKNDPNKRTHSGASTHELRKRPTRFLFWQKKFKCGLVWFWSLFL